MSRASSPVLLRVPPIAYFVVAFAVGFAVDALAFGLPHVASLQSPVFWIGLALLPPAGYFGLGAFALFVRRRMDLMPGHAVSHLVTDGPFAFSRNPMYFGLALLHACLCLIFGLPLTFVLLLAPLLLMQLVVIPAEEEAMAGAFGETYAAYCQRVRRWI